MSKYDYLFKLLIIGDSGVGKSSILTRFTENDYSSNYISTIGVDFKIKTLIIDDKYIKLQIWDTAGQERFRSLSAAYYRGCHGIILVFDVTNMESFTNISVWWNEKSKYAHPDANIVLVGNKIDAPNRVVTKEDALSLAESKNIPYVETSAKSADNIDQMFFDMTIQIKQRIVEDEDTVIVKHPKSNSINIDTIRETKHMCCFY